MCEIIETNNNQSGSRSPSTEKKMWEVVKEAKALGNLAFPTLLTALIFYARSMLSMLFLGYLGDTELAAGSVAIAFANITGYSVLSGLSLGMEPLCSQAFGANRPKLLSLTLQRCVLFLLLSSFPISILWLSMSKIFLLLPQDTHVIEIAQKYLLFLLPDLITNSFLHPIRVYLRTQNITLPVTLASLAGTLLQFLFNYLLMKRGVAGIAAASAASSFSILVLLILYLWISGVHSDTWTTPSRDCLTGWKPLVRLAAPSCFSVCLEWWWYEIMILMCGFLVDPTASVAAMGVLIQTTSLLYVFPSSLSYAVSTRVGNELGAHRAGRAKLSAAVAILFAVIIGFTAATFATLMRWKWGTMYTEDMGILNLTAAALPILGMCEIGNCPQTVACGVVRGTARPKVAASVNLAAFYLVGMPAAVGLAFYFKIGFCGLWLGLLSAQVCCAGLMFIILGITDWEDQACKAQILTAVDESVNGSNGQKEPLLAVVVA